MDECTCHHLSRQCTACATEAIAELLPLTIKHTQESIHHSFICTLRNLCKFPDIAVALTSSAVTRDATIPWFGNAWRARSSSPLQTPSNALPHLHSKLHPMRSLHLARSLTCTFALTSMFPYSSLIF